MTAIVPAHKLAPLLLVSFWVALGMAGCASATPPRAEGAPERPRAADDPPGDEPGDPTLAELLDAHNKQRTEAGLPPLKWNGQLAEAARRHARDMAKHDRLSHEGSDRSTASSRIKDSGYRAQALGENVAEGQESVRDVMKSWMHSPHHRENILGKFSEMGAARATNSDGTTYWAVDFGQAWPKLDPAQAARSMLEAMNRERARADLSPLAVVQPLQDAAQHQAEEMAGQKTLQPKGGDLFERIQSLGYKFRKAAVNLASGEPKAESALESWVNSRSQKANVLGKFSDVGIGYATASDGTPYWCVVFAQP